MIWFSFHPEQIKTVPTRLLRNHLAATHLTNASSILKTHHTARTNQHHRTIISKPTSSMRLTYPFRAHQYTIWCNNISQRSNKNYQFEQVISELRRKEFVLLTSLLLLILCGLGKCVSYGQLLHFPNMLTNLNFLRKYSSWGNFSTVTSALTPQITFRSVIGSMLCMQLNQSRN